MKSCSVYISIIVMVLLSIHGFSQKSPSRADLEKRRSSLLKEINATQQLLQSTEKDRKATVSELRAINAQLAARQKLINNINSELGHINNDIKSTEKEIDILNKNLEVFKMRYAQSIRYAYRNRASQNMVAFLFSAKNFNDGVRRVQYLKRYRDYRKDQAEEIRKTQTALNARVNRLNNDKTQKGVLLSDEEAQKLKIQEESQKTNLIVRELQGREKELLAQINKDQQTASRLQNAIQAEIRKEVELARKKAEEEAAKKRAAEEAARKKAEEEALKIARAEERKRLEDSGEVYNSGQGDVILNVGRPGSTTQSEEKPKDPTTNAVTPVVNTPARVESNKPSYKLSLTPEVKSISDNFTANKGKLPWPVTSGFISGKYGKQAHPVYPAVTIENNGVDITTAKNGAVMAVSGGTVLKVMNIDGYVVMISHGEYFTIYSNLSSANVQVGQKVNFKQAIGTAGTNSEGIPTVNFQIWKVGGNNSSQTLNPEEWIAPR